MKKVEMFKVQSLRRIIVAQFAIILVPLACLLVYQSMANARRNETLSGLTTAMSWPSRHATGIRSSSTARPTRSTRSG